MRTAVDVRPSFTKSRRRTILTTTASTSVKSRMPPTRTSSTRVAVGSQSVSSAICAPSGSRPSVVRARLTTISVPDSSTAKSGARQSQLRSV